MFTHATDSLLFRMGGQGQVNAKKYRVGNAREQYEGSGSA